MTSKKGAIEMSMTTIIVIVLGVTLLILGLVFIRNIFSKTSGLAEEAFGSAEKEIQQRLGATDEMYISGGLRWELEPGKSAARLIAIQNFDDDLSASHDFKVEINPTDNKGSKDWFFISQPGKLKVGEKTNIPVEVKLPNGIIPGSSFSFKVVALRDNIEYASQPIIISVKE